MRVLLWTLLLSFIAGCAMFGDKPADERVVPFAGEPAILWVDWAGTRDRLAREGMAREFCRAVKAARFSHLGLEARGPAGLDIWADQETLRQCAAEEGLRLAAILPLFLANEQLPVEKLSHAAVWDGERYNVVPLAPRGAVPGLRTPALEENRERELQWIRGIVEEPGIDILILSGLGFGDSLADVGPAARDAFASWSGVSIRHWPAEVIGGGPGPLPYGSKGRGSLWAAWTSWRADVLQRFLVDVRTTLYESAGDSPPKLAALVDAPYPMHQREGFNWAGPQANVSGDFGWLPRQYNAQTGAGHLVDAVILGFWEPGLATAGDAEREGYAWWASVRGAMALGQRYAAPGCRIWGAILIEDGAEWDRSALAIKEYGEGLVVLPGSAYLNDPRRFGTTRMLLSR